MTTSSISSFAAQAQAFVDWAEGGDTPPSAADALRYIASLYSLALLLPQPWSDGLCEDDAGPQLDSETRHRVQERASSLPVQTYWEIFDGLVNPAEEPVCMSLVDDIGDIYEDVARGLILYQADRHAEAVWEWSFHFRAHWGAHATAAMRVLHLYLSQEQPDALSCDV